MRIRRECILRAILLAGILAAPAWLVKSSAAKRPAAQKPESVTITLLGTTDLHGRIEPWDYYTEKPVDLGLVKISTLVKKVRAEDPDALLFDCGDMIQDPHSALANYFLDKDPAKPNPLVAAMNALHYDAMVVGNHEFNYNPQPMLKLKGESKFPWLAANIRQPYTDGVQYFPPYIIKTVKGVRIGIVGFITTVAPPSKDYQFDPIIETARRVIPELRPKVDLLVVLLHSGFVHDPLGEDPGRMQQKDENVLPDLAVEVPGIDVIMYGHTHSELPEKFINGVLLTEAKYWGMSLAEANIKMTKTADGHWTVASKQSHTIPVTADVAADQEIVKVVQPYRKELDQYLDTPIGASTKALSGKHSLYEDTPLLDVVQETQMEATHADVSLAFLINQELKIPAGPITVRQAGSIYPDSNNIVAVEMTGAQLKEALEHGAGFFPAWPPPAGQSMQMPPVIPDEAEGVTYEIDLTRPTGDRIRDLKFQGKPLDAAQKLKVAISGSRRMGEDGYAVYMKLPIVSRANDMRELVINHVTVRKKLPTEAVGSWKIVPPEAASALEKAEDSGNAR